MDLKSIQCGFESHHGHLTFVLFRGIFNNEGNRIGEPMTAKTPEQCKYDLDNAREQYAQCRKAVRQDDSLSNVRKLDTARVALGDAYVEWIEAGYRDSEG